MQHSNIKKEKEKKGSTGASSQPLVFLPLQIVKFFCHLYCYHI